jgi:hypothetical protein
MLFGYAIAPIGRVVFVFGAYNPSATVRNRLEIASRGFASMLHGHTVNRIVVAVLTAHNIGAVQGARLGTTDSRNGANRGYCEDLPCGCCKKLSSIDNH